MDKIINTHLEALMVDVLGEFAGMRQKVNDVDEALRLRLEEANVRFPAILDGYEARLETLFDGHETHLKDVSLQLETRLAEIAEGIEKMDITNQQAEMAKAIKTVFEVQQTLITGIYKSQDESAEKINVAVAGAVTLIKKIVESPIKKDERLFAIAVNLLFLAVGFSSGFLVFVYHFKF